MSLFRPGHREHLPVEIFALELRLALDFEVLLRGQEGFRVGRHGGLSDYLTTTAERGTGWKRHNSPQNIGAQGAPNASRRPGGLLPAQMTPNAFTRSAGSRTY